MPTITLLGGELQAGMYEGGGGLYFYAADVSNAARAATSVESGQLPDYRCKSDD
jgi:hypothetical protein